MLGKHGRPAIARSDADPWLGQTATVPTSTVDERPHTSAVGPTRRMSRIVLDLRLGFEPVVAEAASSSGWRLAFAPSTSAWIVASPIPANSAAKTASSTSCASSPTDAARSAAQRRMWLPPPRSSHRCASSGSLDGARAEGCRQAERASDDDHEKPRDRPGRSIGRRPPRAGGTRAKDHQHDRHHRESILGS